MLCAAALLAIVLLRFRLVPINASTAALLMVLVVLGAATVWGLAESLFASVAGLLVFNFFFLPPVGTFTVADPENWVALVAFLITATTASRLSSRARQRAEEAMVRRAEIARLYELSRGMLMDEGEDSIRRAVSRTGQVLGISSLAFYDRGAGRTYGTVAGDPFTEADLERVAISGEALELANFCAVPVRLGSHVIGSMAVSLTELSPQMRDSTANLLAINYERTRSLERVAAAEAAKRGEEFRSSLLDALAHELKTPLTAIRTCVTRLIAIPPRTEEVRQELLAIIDQESERLQATITEAIRLAQVESGALRLELENVPLAELTSFDGVTQAAGSEMLRVDRILLRRAIGQLVENARKYSPSAGEVRIETSVRDGRVEVRVLDRGPGIAPEDRERVFEKFYRGRAWSGKVEGTGMGLAIAKAIIEAHGGTIRVEARPGGGTAVVITLPERTA